MPTNDRKVQQMLKHHLTVNNLITKVNDSDSEYYMIKSISNGKTYTVELNSSNSKCDCGSFRYESGTNINGECKHIMFCRLAIETNLLSGIENTTI